MSSCHHVVQELESLEQEVVTIDGQFKETSLQLKPLEAAKVSAQHAHQVRILGRANSGVETHSVLEFIFL